MRTPADPLRLALAAGAAFVGWKVYRFFYPAAPDPGSGPAGEVDALPQPEADKRPATLTEGEAVAIAAGLWTAFYDSFGEDEAAAAMLLGRARVTDDVRLIVNAYGTTSSVFTPDKTLPEAVRRYLSASDIAAVNEDYREKGIHYQF